MADPSMHSSGPPGQSTQIPMGQRDPQKHGGGYHQMPAVPRGPPHPNARLSGPQFTHTPAFPFLTSTLVYPMYPCCHNNTISYLLSHTKVKKICAIVVDQHCVCVIFLSVK